MTADLSVEFLPALIEIIKLLGIVALVVALVVGFVKLNYMLWSAAFYVPLMAVVGLAASTFLRTEWQADYSVATFVFAAPVGIALFFRYVLKGKFQTPILFAAPAVAGVFLLFMYPLMFEIYLSFHQLNLQTLGRWIRDGQISFAGFQNYMNVLSFGSETKESFWKITGRTFTWTFINLIFHVGFGLLLALALNQKIKGVGIYRTILILPWAIPQLIAVLAWRGEFHATYGYVNHLISVVNSTLSFSWNGELVAPLTWIGFVPQEWWTNPNSLFASICIVNIWLGIPFMMIISLSALQSIPLSYYEAASIDGATRWQQFRNITLPLIKPVMIPSMILGMIWTFNNVNVVFLMTSQRGGSEGADILVSDLYKQAFVYNRYSFSAAYAVVIFAILLCLTAVWMRVSKIAEDPLR